MTLKLVGQKKTRGLKRVLQQQKHEAEQLSFEQSFAKEVEDDREVWLDRVNLHLEKILHKEKKYNNILIEISHRYITRNNICNIKLKQLEEKHKQILIKKNEEDKLEILVDASLIAWGTSSALYPPILKVFGWVFEILGILTNFD